MATTQHLLACALALALCASTAHATGIPGPIVRGPCGKRLTFPFPGTRGFSGLEAVGLTSDQRLVCFDDDTPSLARTIGAVSGLSNGDTRLVGIDFRPATSALWGLGDAGGLYEIDVKNAAATRRAQLGVALDAGANVDVDFNPTVDRLRIVTDSGQNLRVNVDTGMTTEDTDLNYPAPVNLNPATGISAAAYTNNDLSPDTATTLFDLDTSLDQIAIQSPPNGGALVGVGKLLLDASGDVGLDIYSTVRGSRSTENIALAVIATGDRARVYLINLLTGRASPRGTFVSKNQVVDLAIPLNQF
jgi:hypothetical protein